MLCFRNQHDELYVPEFFGIFWPLFQNKIFLIPSPKNFGQFLPIFEIELKTFKSKIFQDPPLWKFRSNFVNFRNLTRHFFTDFYLAFTRIANWIYCHILGFKKYVFSISKTKCTSQFFFWSFLAIFSKTKFFPYENSVHFRSLIKYVIV